MELWSWKAEIQLQKLLQQRKKGASYPKRDQSHHQEVDTSRVTRLKLVSKTVEPLLHHQAVTYTHMSPYYHATGILLVLSISAEGHPSYLIRASPLQQEHQKERGGQAWVGTSKVACPFLFYPFCHGHSGRSDLLPHNTENSLFPFKGIFHPSSSRGIDPSVSFSAMLSYNASSNGGSIRSLASQLCCPITAIQRGNLVGERLICRSTSFAAQLIHNLPSKGSACWRKICRSASSIAKLIHDFPSEGLVSGGLIHRSASFTT
ncbi:uncharacterized protein G2W53_029022 [Senna tora]|uniref:Uncharacterized protein n=1 Tax=Senna tora TaxID=362788 RepID=A0A834T4H5_9FABA|nr:uncharacterized protein G2W53_029022 [Senna tora]